MPATARPLCGSRTCASASVRGTSTGTFRAHTGMTPRAYMLERRAQLVREGLKTGQVHYVDVYDAGYGSSGRFLAVCSRALGMAPQTTGQAGVRETLHFAVGQTSLGAILVAIERQGRCGNSPWDDPAALLTDLQDRFPNANFVGGDERYETPSLRLLEWLSARRSASTCRSTCVGLPSSVASGLRYEIFLRARSSAMKISLLRSDDRRRVRL